MSELFERIKNQALYKMPVTDKRMNEIRKNIGCAPIILVLIITLIFIL